MTRASTAQTWTIPGGALTLYVVGFIPAVWTFYLGVMDQLGADPMKVLERSLGLWSLRFLVLTLAITPLRRYLGVSLLRYRRALGLLAFWYGLMHLSTYLVLDQGGDVAAIWKDIVKPAVHYRRHGELSHSAAAGADVECLVDQETWCALAKAAPLGLCGHHGCGLALHHARQGMAARAAHLCGARHHLAGPEACPHGPPAEVCGTAQSDTLVRRRGS